MGNRDSPMDWHRGNIHFQRRETHIFAIEEGLKKINGETVETFCREVVETNTRLLVEAGTTGYEGGCCRDTTLRIATRPSLIQRPSTGYRR